MTVKLRRILLVAGMALVTGWLAVTFLIYQTARTEDVHAADAIVILGTSQRAGTPSPVFQARLDRAYELYQDGYAPLVILTGGYGEGRATSEAAAGREYLAAKDVDSAALLHEDTGRTTRQSLLNMRHIARQHGVQRIILVSDGFHLFRARMMAEDLSFTVFTAPARNGPIAKDPLIELRYMLREEGVLLLYFLFEV